jgi:hypothetical protein
MREASRAKIIMRDRRIVGGIAKRNMVCEQVEEHCNSHRRHRGSFAMFLYVFGACLIGS